MEKTTLLAVVRILYGKKLFFHESMVKQVLGFVKLVSVFMKKLCWENVEMQRF